VQVAADSHVHSEWSWDAAEGAMAASCQRAIDLGVPAIAFTEHLDHTVWTVSQDDDHLDPFLAGLAMDGRIHPPSLDLAGYLDSVRDCRERFPQLRILTGAEVGEPHRHAARVAALLAGGEFDRVLGSVHSLADGAGFSEPAGLFGRRDASEVIRSYLAEVAVMVSSDQPFEVLAHIDYPVRHWPGGGATFDPGAFEDEFRHALRLTAESGRALEINTKVPLDATILRWWRDEGGAAITFGSDAHDPSRIAHGFREAQRLAEAHGFRPGRSAHDLWGRD
jgi:histidinol-phosphatase (PHP family)